MAIAMNANKTIICIDSQRLNTLQLCYRRYEYTFELNLTPLEVPSYLERGSLMHKMLKTYYTLRKYRTHWALTGTTHEKVIAICVRVGTWYAVKMALPPDEVQETIYQFEEYCKYNEHDGWDRILAVEQVGTSILHEDDDLLIAYEVKPDMVIELSNGIIVVDHKTVKQRKEPTALSNQFMGYCWALKTNNLVVNEIGFQKTLKPNERFQRHVLSYPADVLEEWRESTVWWVKGLLRCTEQKHFPPNYASCGKKWAGCQFAGVCVKERFIREHELFKHFQTSPTWDVGKDL